MSAVATAGPVAVHVDANSYAFQVGIFIYLFIYLLNVNDCTRDVACAITVLQ